MANRRPAKKGVLFIYEEDGRQWMQYLMGILKGPEYSIPCSCVLSCFLREDVTLRNPIHVLILTPDMTKYIDDIKKTLSSSEMSLLVEHGVDSKHIDMHNWTATHKWEDSVENLRKLITTIVELYEEVANDGDYDYRVLDLDVVPTTIYPDQEEIYIHFIKDQNDDIIVKMDGVELKTKKQTKRFFVSQLPAETACGQKTINVFKKDETNPICSTTVTVVTQVALLQNLLDNLESVFKSVRGSEESRRFAAIADMGFHFNPFSSTSDSDLRKFADEVHQLYRRSALRDSGISNTSRAADSYVSMHSIQEIDETTPTPSQPEDLNVSRNPWGRPRSISEGADLKESGNLLGSSWSITEDEGRYMPMDKLSPALPSSEDPSPMQRRCMSMDKLSPALSSCEDIFSIRKEIRKDFDLNVIGAFDSDSGDAPDLKTPGIELTESPVYRREERPKPHQKVGTTKSGSWMDTIAQSTKKFSKMLIGRSKSDVVNPTHRVSRVKRRKSQRVVTAMTAQMMGIPKLPLYKKNSI